MGCSLNVTLCAGIVLVSALLFAACCNKTALCRPQVEPIVVFWPSD